MIRSVRHKALNRFFLEGETRGIAPDLIARLRLMLSALHAADSLDELGSVPGWRLHKLKGELRHYWSLSVSGNWRLIFRFSNGVADDVDLIDYH
ncbi:MAG: type II toxin-antitoxin system RelE/ParE family toxin [Rhizobiales bacterium]|nr:type II toxin-antitoxin system RelE/ParE family toxin [Hyphomicrobiales bacterium]